VVLEEENVEALQAPLWVMSKAPATWRFRTFYRLTKPLMVSILLILNLFQRNFRGALEDLTTKFLWVQAPRTPMESAPMVQLVTKESTL